MPVINWLISKLLKYFIPSVHARKENVAEKLNDVKVLGGEYCNKARCFETDYNAAAKMLKERMDKKFPNGHYAKQRSGVNAPYDHGEDRALAIDTMSAAIAMALRNGASVQQAAEAGAASVGI